jgi:hypothetical protein
MTNEQKTIATKLGLLKLAERLGNVSEACKVMGYSRDSFYRFAEENLILTDVQVAAVESKQEKKRKGRLKPSIGSIWTRRTPTTLAPLRG